MSTTPRAPATYPRRIALGWALVCSVLASLALAATAMADARTDYLVRVLGTSPMFRVRAQAAISLASVETEPAVIEALSAALRDENAAVRAAAASALERHGDPSVLAALRALSNDPESAVRNAAARAVQRLEAVERSQPRARALPASGGTTSIPTPETGARFYVAVGRPGSTVPSISRDTLDALRTFIEGLVRAIPGVQIAPPNETAVAANGVLRSQGLVGFYIDSSIAELTDQPGGGVRARVSIVVQTYPDRNIRSMLSGAATVTAGSGAVVQRQAMEAGLRGALRGLQPVMEAGAASAQAAPSPPRRRRR